MEWENIKGLKFYILYSVLLLGFFVYSGMTGWKWYNDTPTQAERSTRTARSGHIYRYHK